MTARRIALLVAMLAAATAVPASALRSEPSAGAPLGISTEVETSAPSAASFDERASAPPGDAIEIAPPRVAQLRDEPVQSEDELGSIDDSFLAEDLGPDPADRDRAPHWNRRVFAFNESFIRLILRPISRGYQALTPKFAREMILRGFDNLESPVILANDLMQLDPCRAGRTLGRFALNTLAGLGGLLDVAAEMGVPREDADFGETLGRWGVRSGSYFVLPLLGPSTARDTLGELVDTALRPEIWLLGGFPRLALTGGDGLSTYDIQAERLDALRSTSIDFYAALRSAYLMDRDARIDELRGAGRCGLGKRLPRE